MKPIMITVSPARHADGRPRFSRRETLFDVTRQVVAGSPRPLLDTARVLLAEGIDPATPLAMRRDGAGHDALHTTVGTAARLTVSGKITSLHGDAAERQSNAQSS